jgi:hypothetical protein
MRGQSCLLRTLHFGQKTSVKSERELNVVTQLQLEVLKLFKTFKTGLLTPKCKSKWKMKCVKLKLRILQASQLGVARRHHHVVASVVRFSIQLEYVYKPCNNIQLIAMRLERKK